jgi:choline O-acetyltransferase
MAEYLRALKPIVSAHQYEKTKNIIKQFSVQPGPKLHQFLVDKREAEDNWVGLVFYFHFTIQIFCDS